MSDALIDYIDAPVLVGDPQANAVHVNPAFERCFGVDAQEALGMPLAELFEGGAREAMLVSVASACQRGGTARCRIRERGVGYCVVISPILRDGEGVGVVVLLSEEIEGTERLMSLRREMEVPIDEISTSLETLLQETGGRRNPGHRARLEDSLRSLGQLRKHADELSAVLVGQGSSTRSERFDPSGLVRQVAESVRELAETLGVELLLLAPASLDGFEGDGATLATALRAMVEARLAVDPPPARLTLAARKLGAADGEALLLSVSEKPRSGAFSEPFAEPGAVQTSLAGLGALVHGTAHPRLGRTSVVRLPGASRH